MTLYTFQMCNSEGISTCFVTRELQDDGATSRIADELLAEHASAVCVCVWDDERAVRSHHRVAQNA